MHRPVLVTPATDLPLSIEMARKQCRIDADSLDDVALAEVDSLLESYIRAAAGHLEGWTGILGRVLGTSTWRQDFDGFSQCMALPLGPVQSISSVTCRNAAGQISTVAGQEYTMLTDGAGVGVCRFRNSYAWPGDLYEVAAVSVTYVAGYDEIPEPIVQAIRLMVGAWYENREEAVVGVSIASLPDAVAVDRLIRPWRRQVL